jgi:hypothetical protein
VEVDGKRRMVPHPCAELAISNSAKWALSTSPD